MVDTETVYFALLRVYSQGLDDVNGCATTLLNRILQVSAKTTYSVETRETRVVFLGTYTDRLEWRDTTDTGSISGYIHRPLRVWRQDRHG